MTTLPKNRIKRKCHVCDRLIYDDDYKHERRIGHAPGAALMWITWCYEGEKPVGYYG